MSGAQWGGGRIGRRDCLRLGAAGVGRLALPASIAASGCSEDGAPPAVGRGPSDGARGSGPADAELRLVAEPGEADLGPLGTLRTSMYNGRFPGEEIRVREGGRLRVVLENRLPDPTTVHWHGVPVPNFMDGVQV